MSDARKFEWTKANGSWFGIYGKFRATITKSPTGIFYNWSVTDASGWKGGGGTTSATNSKRAANAELERQTAA